ncbi:MAG: SEC-C domain-containing protein [Planctomycetes bacterium]|nr:SEC-C domain-containing protein [Planctomycetota bacterium]
MPALLHYVGSDVIATADQIQARIQAYVAPFDLDLVSICGVSATDSLRVCRWISDNLQAAIDLDQILTASTHDYSIDSARPNDRPENRAARNCVVYLKDIRAAFPKIADAYWSAYTIARGAGPPLSFPTESTVFDEKPLILRDSTSAWCPSANALFWSLLSACERRLIESNIKTRFLRHRDQTLEREAFDLFRRFFKEKARIYSGLFETPTQQFEHDVVIIVGDRCLIVEAKASEPVEPFRDPERAFTRLRDAFRSEKGIQGAFKQANRLVRRLRTEEKVELFDERGNVVVRTGAKELRAAYAVCITRDDHGPLAINLDLLLEKEPADTYPWVINSLDLATICDCREYWSRPPEMLFEYLDERLLLHGKAFAVDELDIMAFWLWHGSLRSILNASEDIIAVNPHYSDLIDKMYLARLRGGPRVELRSAAPVPEDERGSMASGEDPPHAAKRLGSSRNKPCPCGSGKKFKNCHGVA